MLVTLPQSLTVTETFTLGRFGEVSLSVGGRLLTPTSVVAPGAPALAQQDLNDRSRILLDDGNNQQNIDPTRYPDRRPERGEHAARRRHGDRPRPACSSSASAPTASSRSAPIAFDADNPRPTAPAAVGGTLQVAAFNVLNYFNGDGLGGGFPTAARRRHAGRVRPPARRRSSPPWRRSMPTSSA